MLKDSAEGDLIAAIRAVHQGKTFFTPEISKMLVEDYNFEIRTRGTEESYDLLSSREREILQLLAERKSNKEIAQALNLRPAATITAIELSFLFHNPPSLLR